MQRIDGITSQNGRFVEKDRVSSRPGTLLSAKWLNNIQEEICGAIEGSGLKLDESAKNQLSLAIRRWQRPTVKTVANPVLIDFPNMMSTETGELLYESNLIVQNFPSKQTRVTLSVSFALIEAADLDDVFWSLSFEGTVIPEPDPETMRFSEVIFGSNSNANRRYPLMVAAYATGNFHLSDNQLHQASAMFGVTDENVKKLAINIKPFTESPPVKMQFIFEYTRLEEELPR